MFKLALISLSLAACATGATLGVDHQTPRIAGGLQLTMTGHQAVAFPSAIEPVVPSVDRLGRSIYATLGDTATAELDLCVAPSGKVTKVSLARSSSMPELDAALLRDAQSFRFETMPGQSVAGLHVCERAQITYHPY